MQTKNILNQAVADLSVAASIVHQVHWYMRGSGFFYLHPKMDELMDALNEHLDEFSERLITIGGQPFSTLTEFADNSNLEEKSGSFDDTIDERLERLVEVYSYLSEMAQQGLDVTSEDADDVSNDMFVAFKKDVDKTIWMLTAELGKASVI